MGHRAVMTEKMGVIFSVAHTDISHTTTLSSVTRHYASVNVYVYMYHNGVICH